MNPIKFILAAMRSAGVFGLYMDGGSSAPAPTSTTNTQTSIPEYAKPYVEKMLGQTEALAGTPYQTYDRERIAGFNPMQQQAFQGAQGMQGAPQMATATGMAAQAGLGALNTQYQGGQFANQFQAPGQYDPAQVAMYQAQAPSLQQYSMGPAQQVRTQSFAAPGSAEAYMSPYMQSVVEKQQREAQRTADIASTQRGAQAVGAGAFGGSRQAIMEAEAARNLAQQKGDIQATGSQAAYQQAQQQFNAEQAARLQAQQANQQAGLTVGGQNLQAQLGIQQLGAGQSMQAQLANQQALQQAQQLAEQSRQYGAGYGMTGAQTAAQYGQSAQQLGEQSRQYGAGLGLQGLQTALQGAGQLGQLGGQQFAQGMDINKLQAGYGQQQQQQQQNIMQQQYQDFLNQQNYPYKQLGFMSDMLRGLPLSQSSQQMYQQQPSALTQVAGLAPVAYGVSRMAGMAEGGITGDANVSSILSKLSDPQLEQAKQQARQNRDEERVKEIEDIQRERASARAGISAAAPQQEQQGGIASAASDSMMDRMLPTEAAMARGGIVAFARGGDIERYQVGGNTMGGFESSPELVEAQEMTANERSRAQIIDALERKAAFLTNAEAPQAAEVRAQLEAFKASSATTLPGPVVPGGAASPVGAATAPPEGLTSPAAQAALPPDISTMGARGTAGVGGGGGGSTDFGKMFDATRARMEKSVDPFAAETQQLGEEGVRQSQAKKARLEADQAKQANIFGERKSQLEDRAKAIGKREAFNENMAFISMGAAMMTEPGNIGKVLGKGIKVGSEQYISGMDKIERSKELLADAKEKLADLERDRSDMSLREIRAAEDDISTSQLNAKKMMLQGRKDLGAKNDSKSLAVFESQVKQQLAREAQAAAARTAASTADKPGETERMMAQLGAIQSGKASFAGKTGVEGAKAFQESLSQIGSGKYGVRHAGPAPKPVSYSPADKKLAESLGEQLSFLATKPKTDKVAQEKAASINAALVNLERKYAGSTGGGAGGALPSSVSADGQTYPRPANFTDAQWRAYIQSVGAS